MGYKPGEGLGSKGQGITTPVEAFKRRGKGTIGFHGTERSDRSLKDFPTVDSEEEEEKEFQKQLQQWKRKPEVSLMLRCCCLFLFVFCLFVCVCVCVCVGVYVGSSV